MKIAALSLLAFFASNVNAFVAPNFQARSAIMMSAEPEAATAEADVNGDAAAETAAAVEEATNEVPFAAKEVVKKEPAKKLPWPRSASQGAKNIWKKSNQEQNAYFAVINCLFSDELKDLYANYRMKPSASDVEGRKINKELYWRGLKLFNMAVRNKVSIYDDDESNEKLYNYITNFQYNYPEAEKYELDNLAKMNDSKKFAQYVNKIHKDTQEIVASWEGKQDGEVKDVLKGVTKDLFSEDEATRFDLGKYQKPLYFFKFLEQNPAAFENIMNPPEVPKPASKAKKVPTKNDKANQKSPFDKYTEITGKRQEAARKKNSQFS